MRQGMYRTRWAMVWAEARKGRSVVITRASFMVAFDTSWLLLGEKLVLSDSWMSTNILIRSSLPRIVTHRRWEMSIPSV
jgi:hypothetical protein